MKANQIQWLKRLDQAICKSTKMPIKLTRKTLEKCRDPFSRRAVILDDLCDQSGMHLALTKSMIERLESLKFDPSVALDGASWHLPYSVLRIGTEVGSDVPPCNAWFATKREFEKAYKSCGMGLNAPEVADDEPLLLVVISSSVEDSVEDHVIKLPAALTALHTLHEIVDGLKDQKWKQADDVEMSHLDDAETELMQRVIRLIVSLGIYLSLDDIEPVAADRKAIWAPKIVRTSKLNSKLSVAMLDSPVVSSGRAEHMVREHLRNLKDERYYKGKWQTWPRGSRYALVKAHVR